ncbi:hypothetical protein ACEPAI_9049 [Sanghuangporus weigelae]
MTTNLQSKPLEDLIEKSFKLSWLPRSSLARREFCTNLCIVAFGIRAGYLIDSFSPAGGEKDLQRLLETLRRGSPRFNEVRLAYTAEHEQYFFLNMSLLSERTKRLCSSKEHGRHPTFILLGQYETVIDPPQDVIETVRQVAESPEDPIRLPEGLTPKTLIPLCGFLLEFPVAYVPFSTDSEAFLSGVPLDVYECAIFLEEDEKDTKKHILLKFSCPAHLGAAHGMLAPDSIAKDLEQVFRSRLERVSCPWSLRINHTVITQDRVAL